MILEGTHCGIWLSIEPTYFINFGIHLDVKSPNIILYVLWWQILVGRYTCEIEQPHWDEVYTLNR